MLVLASASPRRQELLRNAGIPFVVQSTNIPEVPQPGEAPRAFAERMARDKALAVFRRRPNDFVLGADTIVVVDGEILGKPRDSADAVRMLRVLSGCMHQVVTGVCLVGPRLRTEDQQPEAGFEDIRSETTLVTMDPLGDDDIHSYVSTGEPRDKAGAYALQGSAAAFTERIEGSYAAVVGLPLCEVVVALRRLGWW